jgi:hypothetical protein
MAAARTCRIGKILVKIQMQSTWQVAGTKSIISGLWFTQGSAAI